MRWDNLSVRRNDPNSELGRAQRALEVLRRALKESQRALEGIRAARKGLQLARAASSVMPKGGCLELDEGLAALGEVFTTAGIIERRRGNCKLCG